MAYIEFHGICKSYDGVHQVLKNIDLNIEKGELVTLLGQADAASQHCFAHWPDWKESVKERSFWMERILRISRFKNAGSAWSSSSIRCFRI